MLISESYQQLLRDKDITLSGMGIRDIGLTRENALRAVSLLQKDSVPILGGDVFFRRGSKIEVAYANWHSDPKPGEDRDAYNGRSWTATFKYIQDFPDRPDVELLFALVVGR
jgi:hypothetical protein